MLFLAYVENKQIVYRRTPLKVFSHSEAVKFLPTLDTPYVPLKADNPDDAREKLREIMSLRRFLSLYKSAI